LSVNWSPAVEGFDRFYRPARAFAGGKQTPQNESEMANDTSTAVILVVDDSHDAAECLALVLEIEGFRALTAHDARSALDCIDRDAPDAVLLDLGLPDLDGVEVGRRIRARSDGAGILLVAVSGHGRQEDMDSTREAGFDAHLVKPVDPGRIVELLAARGLAASAGQA